MGHGFQQGPIKSGTAFIRSLRGRRLKGMGKGVLGVRETRGGARGGREGNACQETIVFLVFNIDQANVKILIG